MTWDRQYSRGAEDKYTRHFPSVENYLIPFLSFSTDRVLQWEAKFLAQNNHRLSDGHKKPIVRRAKLSFSHRIITDYLMDTQNPIVRKPPSYILNIPLSIPAPHLKYDPQIRNLHLHLHLTNHYY